MTTQWDQPLLWCSICYRPQTVASDRGVCLCGGPLEVVPPPPTMREIITLLKLVGPRIGMARAVDPAGEMRAKLTARCASYAAVLELHEGGGGVSENPI